MPVHIGPDDLGLFEDPQPSLLREVSGLTPEPGGLHIRLDPLSVRSTQRLALSAYGGGYVVALWPAELKGQAVYLYGNRLATPMIRRARELGWTATAALQFAFRNSAPSQRLYIRPDVDALDYARRWEEDVSNVGQHSSGELRRRIWPWLKQLGYVADAHDPTLDEWLAQRLGRRPAFPRPGLRLQARRTDRTRMGAEVDAILAAGEPGLPR